MSIAQIAFVVVSLLTASPGFAEDQRKSVGQNEAQIIRELKQTGADIELDQQGHAISVWVDEETFSDEHLKQVAALTHLKEIRLEHTAVTDAGLFHLRALPQLTELMLVCKYEPGKPAKITDAGMPHLKPLVNLRLLSLEDADVTDQGLKHLSGLTKLEDLDLFGTEISDAGLVHLQGLKRLQYLNISETQWEKKRGAITPEAARALQKHLPKCDIDY